MTDPKARPPTDSEERVRELEKALRLIAADGYGLQGLVEEGASDTEIAEYWKSELDRRRSMARAALGEARETASASESLKPCPHGFRYRPECPECSLDIEPLNSEQGALRASIDDLLAKAKKAFQRKQDILRAAKASALNTEAEKYRAGVALCEWTDAAELLECIVPAGAPPAPDLLRENARLREGPGAAHAASPSVCEVEAANPWRDALIELLDLKNLISEAPDNIIIDRCPASGRGEAHGEHEAGEWVAWDSDYPDEGAISLKGLIAPAHIAVVDTPSDRSGTAPQAPSALEEELTRARAAHLENATLLANAQLENTRLQGELDAERQQVADAREQLYETTEAHNALVGLNTSLHSALLAFVKAHDAAKQAAIGPEYSRAECDCDLCCDASAVVPTGGPPDYAPFVPSESSPTVTGTPSDDRKGNALKAPLSPDVAVAAAAPAKEGK